MGPAQPVRLLASLRDEIASAAVLQGKYPYKLRESLRAASFDKLKDACSALLPDENDKPRGPSKKELVKALIAYIMQASLFSNHFCLADSLDVDRTYGLAIQHVVCSCQSVV